MGNIWFDWFQQKHKGKAAFYSSKEMTKNSANYKCKKYFQIEKNLFGVETFYLGLIYLITELLKEKNSKININFTKFIFTFDFKY